MDQDKRLHFATPPQLRLSMRSECPYLPSGQNSGSPLTSTKILPITINWRGGVPPG